MIRRTGIPRVIASLLVVALCVCNSGCAGWRERLLVHPNLSEDRATRHAETLESFELHRDQAQLAAAIDRYQAGDPLGCHSRLATLVERRPNFVEARLRLAEVCWSLDDPAAAEGHYRAVLANHPNHAEVQHGLGVLLTAQGRFDEARPFLAQARALDPENAAYQQAALP